MVRLSDCYSSLLFWSSLLLASSFSMNLTTSHLAPNLSHQSSLLLSLTEAVPAALWLIGTANSHTSRHPRPHHRMLPSSNVHPLLLLPPHPHPKAIVKPYENPQPGAASSPRPTQHFSHLETSGSWDSLYQRPRSCHLRETIRFSH
jgi:hypothetical protein